MLDTKTDFSQSGKVYNRPMHHKAHYSTLTPVAKVCHKPGLRLARRPRLRAGVSRIRRVAEPG